MKLENLSKYTIFKDGRVFSDYSNKFLTPTPTKGYMRLTLITDDGKRLNKDVHRLVGIAFVKNPNNYPEINHLDGDKSNNHYTNLEWCTSSQNSKHSVEVLKKQVGEAHGRAKLTEEQVREIRKLREEGYSTYRLGIMFNINRGAIWKICNNENWKQTV